MTTPRCPRGQLDGQLAGQLDGRFDGRRVGRAPGDCGTRRAHTATGESAPDGEDGQILLLLVGLIGLILMVLGLGWDASNWFLGHRALDNLADGAAIAAASDVDVRTFYASGGREITVSNELAMATVRRYLLEVAGDSGLKRVRASSIRVERSPAGPRVTVELRATTPAAFLSLLHVVAPEMVGSASATARVRAP